MLGRLLPYLYLISSKIRLDPNALFRIRDENGKVSQAKLDAIWPRLRVLARAQPSDKYVLVKGIIDSKVSKNRYCQSR